MADESIRFDSTLALYLRRLVGSHFQKPSDIERPFGFRRQARRGS